MDDGGRQLHLRVARVNVLGLCDCVIVGTRTGGTACNRRTGTAVAAVAREALFISMTVASTVAKVLSLQHKAHTVGDAEHAAPNVLTYPLREATASKHDSTALKAVLRSNSMACSPSTSVACSNGSGVNLMSTCTMNVLRCAANQCKCLG